jgi:hypothetical protein
VYSSKQLKAAAAPAASTETGRPAAIAPASHTMVPRPRRASRLSDDDFLAHYFRRIDPAVAASFTKEQRHAIRTMFGDRGATRHAIDVRCTFPLGWRRCYLVFLLGRDRRKMIRPRNGLPGDMGDWLAYLAMSMGLLVAIFVLLSIVKI